MKERTPEVGHVIQIGGLTTKLVVIKSNSPRTDLLSAQNSTRSFETIPLRYVGCESHHPPAVGMRALVNPRPVTWYLEGGIEVPENKAVVNLSNIKIIGKINLEVRESVSYHMRGSMKP